MRMSVISVLALRRCVVPGVYPVMMMTKLFKDKIVLHLIPFYSVCYVIHPETPISVHADNVIQTT